MKILVDTHTHTNCSAHAYGTIVENLKAAKDHGLEMLCMTNHGPEIPDGAHIYQFYTMYELPDEVDGVKLLKGAEANIMNVNGDLDIPEFLIKKMDLLIASMHDACFPSTTIEDHTNAWLNVIKNPYVTILGHSGNPDYPYDYERVIKSAKEHNKCIEINNHSFCTREGSTENCKRIAKICKDTGTNIVVSSDAHTSFNVGVFDNAIKILEEIDFPEALIMNLNAERFSNYLREFRQGVI